MRLDITRGIQNKGVAVSFELEESWERDRWAGEEILYVQPVTFSGTYMINDETIVVNGTAGTTIQSPCARCLEPTNTEVTAEVQEAFVRDKGDGGHPDEDQYTYTGHILDLNDAVRSALLLELPTRVFCREDCRGLCPQCGTNLNIRACSCQKDPTRRNPFSALASLLNEDEEV